MMTLLGAAAYLLLATIALRLFRMTKRSDEVADRLFRQYSADVED